MENRLTELEIKLSFTEDLVEELNRTVYAQQRQIDALLQTILAMRQQIENLVPEEKRSLREELPPHY